MGHPKAPSQSPPGRCKYLHHLCVLLLSPSPLPPPRPPAPSPTRPLSYRSQLHPNRFVREVSHFMVATISKVVGATGALPLDDEGDGAAAAEAQSADGAIAVFAQPLADGLSDNWSQVQTAWAGCLFALLRSLLLHLAPRPSPCHPSPLPRYGMRPASRRAPSCKAYLRSAAMPSCPSCCHPCASTGVGEGKGGSRGGCHRQYEGALDGSPPFYFNIVFEKQLWRLLPSPSLPPPVPRPCRYYEAEGVRLYSQQTWREVMGEAGRVKVAQFAPQVREGGGHGTQSGD